MAIFLCVMLALSASTLIATWSSSGRNPDVTPPSLPAVQPNPVVPPDPALVRRAFYDQRVRPKILVADTRNRDAAERSLRKLAQLFEQYGRGVDPLVDELTSWSTRFSVLRRMPGDWWQRTDRVRPMIQQKIESHLFSDAKLIADLQRIVEEFSDEVTANQTAMVGDIKASVSAADLVGLPQPDYQDFARSVGKRLRDRATDDAAGSLYAGVLTELAGAAGGFATEQLLAQVFVRLTAATAATAAGAGGAGATSAAAGGGGGSILGGPVGAAAGIAGGILVGLAIDWWASRRYEATIRTQMTQTLAEIESAVRQDMSTSLQTACDSLAVSYASVLRQHIVGPDPTTADDVETNADPS